jgi:hypothetical protein
VNPTLPKGRVPSSAGDSGRQLPGVFLADSSE